MTTVDRAFALKLEAASYRLNEIAREAMALDELLTELREQAYGASARAEAGYTIDDSDPFWNTFLAEAAALAIDQRANAYRDRVLAEVDRS